MPNYGDSSMSSRHRGNTSNEITSIQKASISSVTAGSVLSSYGLDERAFTQLLPDIERGSRDAL